MAKIIGKIILLAALFGALLYAVVYFMASHSDGFEFAEKTIRNSHMIKLQVGEIKRVQPDAFGSYDEKTVGSDEWVTMDIKVEGTTKTIVLSVRAKKANGTWMIEQATTEGRPVTLD